MDLRGRSFLTLLDYSPEEIRYLLDLSSQVKREKRERVFPMRLKNRNVVLLFDKTSTRTRCAFEVAALDEGVVFVDQDGRPESKHLLGTARMGTDPKTSVTDPWGRLHDLDNVWICDGSLWPTSTAFNPTLTQQALAWRTAAYIADPANVRP